MSNLKRVVVTEVTEATERIMMNSLVEGGEEVEEGNSIKKSRQLNMKLGVAMKTKNKYSKLKRLKNKMMMIGVSMRIANQNNLTKKTLKNKMIG